MSLRRRLSLTVAVVALLVVVAAGGAAWLTTRSVLRGNIDDGLRAQAQAVVDRGGPRIRPGARGSGIGGFGGGFGGAVRLPIPPPREGGPAEYVQLLSSTDATPLPGSDLVLPVSAADRAAASTPTSEGSASSDDTTTVVGPRDVSVDGAHLRMVTVPLTATARQQWAQAGFDLSAMQFARSMGGVDSALRTLWIVLLGVGVVVVSTAALLARATARRVLRPVTDLAAAAGHVEATEDLDGRLPVRSADEVGELTSRFNGMLARLQGSRAELDRSMVEQRNLVADASHELRTPVTSLRTNAEVLLEDDAALSPEERRGILADVRDQAEDLGTLVADLIELARGDAPDPSADEPVALDALVQECVGRARRDHRGVAFTVTAEPIVVAGRPDRLARAISNLVNNAALHGAEGEGAVEVVVRTASPDAPPVGAPLRLEADAGSLWAGRSASLPTPAPVRRPRTTDDERAQSRDGALAVVRVVDHGAGVAPEDRVRIFDRFRRGDQARGRHGSGLGLAIVRQVAVVHGGSVAVEGTPGGGATFVLSMPVLDEG